MNDINQLMKSKKYEDRVKAIDLFIDLSFKEKEIFFEGIKKTYSFTNIQCTPGFDKILIMEKNRLYKFEFGNFSWNGMGKLGEEVNSWNIVKNYYISLNWTIIELE